MPLLFVDLDNTLIDRAASYRRWATAFLAERGVDPGLLDAMVRADGDGLRPKPEVALDLTELLSLTPDEASTIITVLRAGVLDHLRADPENVEALDRAKAAGWTPFIVTNGVVAQQEGKISRLDLAPHVAGWVISEGVGVTKPDPEIFRIAAEQAGGTLEGAWMIGDSAEADIEGAHRAGINSVYLSRGREWTTSIAPPTAFADSFVAAVDLVIGARPVEG